MARRQLNEGDIIVARSNDVASHVDKGMVGEIIEVVERFEYPDGKGGMTCLDSFRVTWRCGHVGIPCWSYAERHQIRLAYKNEV